MMDSGKDKVTEKTLEAAVGAQCAHGYADPILDSLRRLQAQHCYMRTKPTYFSYMLNLGNILDPRKVFMVSCPSAPFT